MNKDTIQDEKRAAREQLVYSHLINSDIIGFFFSNAKRQISNANKRFLDMIGYSLEEIRAKELPLISLVPESYHALKAETIQNIIDKGYGGPIEIEIARKDGTLVPVLLSGVIADPEKLVFLFLIVDLSQQKKLERKKDEFISIASHELKTPLTIIKGYLQLANQKVLQQDYEKLPQFLGVLNQEVNKLTDLLNDMLDISRIETNKFNINKSEFDIVELVETTIKGMKTLLKSKTIELEKDSDRIELSADYTRIGQVLTNLLTNAIKHSYKGGTIIVRVKKQRKTVRIEVQDFGQGIHREKLDKIFEKFFQIEKLEGNLEGLGLGLYISSVIVNRHHGKIGVKSKYGKGATFYFSLPLEPVIIS